jgi:transcriptional regulator with XRE-family HTH domain
MTSHFGARMRQHREQRNVSIATVADQTKIKASLLEALERDDISHWPPGIFRRAYIRAYASAIGLDPDNVIREFLEVYPEPVEIVEAPPPPTGLRGFVGSAMGSLSRIRHNGWAHAQADPVGPPPAAERKAPESPMETVPTMGRVATPETAPAKVERQLDLLAAARLCTALGRVETAVDVQPLLRDAAAILDATGLIVWVWHPLEQELRPALVHGYPDHVAARLPHVRRDDDNLTAAAFRSEQTLAAAETAHASGALALPLLTPGSCAGVLTLELARGSEGPGSVRAVATFFAAMLAQLVGGTPAPPTDQPDCST